MARKKVSLANMVYCFMSIMCRSILTRMNESERGEREFPFLSVEINVSTTLTFSMRENSFPLSLSEVKNEPRDEWGSFVILKMSNTLSVTCNLRRSRRGSEKPLVNR